MKDKKNWIMRKAAEKGRKVANKDIVTRLSMRCKSFIAPGFLHWLLPYERNERKVRFAFRQFC